VTGRGFWSVQKMRKVGRLVSGFEYFIIAFFMTALWWVFPRFAVLLFVTFLVTVWYTVVVYERFLPLAEKKTAPARMKKKAQRVVVPLFIKDPVFGEVRFKSTILNNIRKAPNTRSLRVAYTRVPGHLYLEKKGFFRAGRFTQHLVQPLS